PRSPLFPYTTLFRSRGMRVAAASRTVTAIIVPVDVQHADHEEPERRHGAVFSSPVAPRQRLAPDEAELRRAAEVLNAGERVAILDRKSTRLNSSHDQ